jgi:MFS family permease
MTSGPASRQPASAWAPLRHSLFRWLWIASLVSQIGSFMTDVAQGWLMTSLAASPLAVALLTTASSVPFFLLSLPAGALADVVDRRRLLIATQCALVVVTGVLAEVTFGGWATPAMLIALAFAMGIAASLNSPAWVSIPAELLPRADLPGGIALNGLAFNVARVLGPALGGALVVSAGPAAVFALDAISTFGVIAVLYRWRRQRAQTVLPAERMFGAMKAGLRFARHSPPLRRVLLRTAAFMSCGCIALALLPVLARETQGGPLAYGLLLGSLGLGAVAGAVVLPRVRRKASSDAVLTAGSLVFAADCLGMGQIRALALLCPIFVLGGMAWIAVLSTLNAAAQVVSPSWVRSRASAVYMLVFQGAVAGGAALWGAVATAAGLPLAFACAAGGLVLGVIALIRVRIGGADSLDLSPTRHWPEPTVVGRADPEAGPVLVQIEYRIDPTREAEFVREARALEVTRRRDGAFEWWLLRDSEDAARYVEIFAVETWAEHLRQHERVSAADRELEERVRAFHLGEHAPARHLIATTLATTEAHANDRR